MTKEGSEIKQTEGYQSFWRHFYVAFVVLFAGVAIAFSVTPMVKAFKKPLENKDYTIWQEYGRLGITGKPLYPEDPLVQTFEYMYPPFPAVFVWGPASLLPAPGFVLFLVLLNTAAWLGVIFASVWLATGKWVRQEPLLYLVPSLICIGYVWDTFLLGQINILLLALVLGAFVLIKKKWPMAAGALIALAAAIKAFPVLLVSWLIWRRQWKALLGFSLAAVMILLVLPGLVRGYGQTVSELGVWFGGMAEQEFGQRAGIGVTYKNQSLKSVVFRLTQPFDAGDDNGVHYTVNVVSLSDRQRDMVFLSLAGVLGLWFAIATPPRVGKKVWLPEPEENITGIEVAMIVTLIVFASPLSWTYFYVWLIPGLTVLTHEWLRRGHNSWKRVFAATLLIVVALVLGSAVTQVWNEHRPQAYGATLLGAMLMFCVLTVYLVQARMAVVKLENDRSKIAVEG
jgi:hypothetical protein